MKNLSGIVGILYQKWKISYVILVIYENVITKTNEENAIITFVIVKKT